MKLFITKDCEPCTRVKQYIQEQGIKVEMVEVLKKDDGTYELDGKLFPTHGKAFPMLLLQRGAESNLLCGEEGVKQVLDMGFIYQQKECPYYKEKCKLGECAKFTVLYRGSIPEGGCSDWWGPILNLEIISLLQKQNNGGQ